MPCLHKLVLFDYVHRSLPLRRLSKRKNMASHSTGLFCSATLQNGYSLNIYILRRNANDVQCCFSISRNTFFAFHNDETMTFMDKNNIRAARAALIYSMDCPIAFYRRPDCEAVWIRPLSFVGGESSFDKFKKFFNGRGKDLRFFPDQHASVGKLRYKRP